MEVMSITTALVFAVAAQFFLIYKIAEKQKKIEKSTKRNSEILRKSEP